MITKSHDASRLTLPLGDGAVSCDIAEMLLQKYVAQKCFYKNMLQKNTFTKGNCKKMLFKKYIAKILLRKEIAQMLSKKKIHFIGFHTFYQKDKTV